MILSKQHKKRIEELESEVKTLRLMGRTKRDPKKGLGGVVQSLREKTGMGLRHFALYSDISPGLLSKIENGFGNPTLVTIQRIARGLKISASELLKGL